MYLSYAPPALSYTFVLQRRLALFRSLSGQHRLRNTSILIQSPNSQHPSETQKFRDELVKKLSEERETFGDDLEAVVEVCAKILDEFLQKEYGGPGTLLVEPFTDMFVALKGKKLPGASFAARASLLWAQNFVDQDWEAWNRNNHHSKHP